MPRFPYVEAGDDRYDPTLAKNTFLFTERLNNVALYVDRKHRIEADVLLPAQIPTRIRYHA
jgi:hypothetical protein